MITKYWPNLKNQEMFENKEKYIGKLFVKNNFFKTHGIDSEVLLLDIVSPYNNIPAYGIYIYFLKKDGISKQYYFVRCWQDYFDEVF